ncbi:MAG: YlbF family regulator [Firmicutes bacterium]|nr:YlbF family regulator [Bacillota bacterium]
MEVYDQAHALARSLRNSQSFQRLLTAQKILVQNPQKWERVQEVRKRQIELAAKELSGKTIPPQTTEALEQMMQALMVDEEIKEYLIAEERFGRQLADIQNILAEAVKDLTLLKQDPDK